MRLYQIFPQPSPVTLGGRHYHALPLRLKHLAALETWLASQVVCPVDDYRPMIAEAEGRERQVLIAQAFLRAETWPPKIESPLGSTLLMTEDGLRRLLGFMVEPCIPLDSEDIAHIAKHITAEEYIHLVRVAYGQCVLDELVGMMDETPQQPHESKSWGEILYDLADGRYADLPMLADLFVTQVLWARSRGMAGEGKQPMRVTGSLWSAAQQRQAIFAEAEERNLKEDTIEPEDADGHQ